jgi:hypothetical protein
LGAAPSGQKGFDSQPQDESGGQGRDWAVVGYPDFELRLLQTDDCELLGESQANRQLGFPDSGVRRVQLAQDKLGATANRSAANIRITIVSLATLISRFSNIFVLGSS